ncbi:MAG TPA: hypothetical protein VG714_08540 [Acidobacteriaceae bacterium]|nr:hypothetical protein [Acidobacteriaceae bacterium]
MATVKKGMLTATGEWWKHLRTKKRAFWKSERQAAKKLTRRQDQEQVSSTAHCAGETNHPR